MGGGLVRLSEMLAYLVKRLLMAVFVLLIISILIFVAVRLAPGDPVMNKIGPYGDASPENYQRVAAELGLDKSLVTQYLVWLRNCVRLDFGGAWHYHPLVFVLPFAAAALVLLRKNEKGTRAVLLLFAFCLAAVYVLRLATGAAPEVVYFRPETGVLWKVISLLPFVGNN